MLIIDHFISSIKLQKKLWSVVMDNKKRVLTFKLRSVNRRRFYVQEGAAKLNRKYNSLFIFENINSNASSHFEYFPYFFTLCVGYITAPSGEWSCSAPGLRYSRTQQFIDNCLAFPGWVHVCHPVCVSACLSITLSLCHSVSLPVSHSVSQPVTVSASVSVCLSNVSL